MPDIDIIIKATDRASGPLKDVNRELGHLDGHSRGLLGPLGSLAKALGTGLKVAAGAAVVALGAVGAVLGTSVKAAASMEQSVADIMAIFGNAAPPVEELNKAITDLGLDPKLKVSAVQAADAIAMLAKNGITWQQIQDGMARSTVLLANATNDDFALAADVATNAMVNFKKGAGDMTEVVNGIIGVTQASQFDINDYALAIGQTGGVAGSVGVDFDDFNAALAATSSSFFSGSDAGTSFKVFLQRLVPDTKSAKTAMRELGLLTEEGGNAFFDAAGNMESMSVIAGALQKAVSGLSEEQKILTMTDIFGTDAQRTALALAEAGAEKIDSLKSAIGETSAEASAATRMDTLTGSFEIFKGVIETLGIQLGTVFMPIAREFLEWATEMAIEHGPKIIEWAKGLAKAIQDFLPVLMNFVTNELPNWRTRWDDWAMAAWQWITDKAIPAVMRVLGDWGRAIWGWVTENLPTWKAKLAEWANAAWQWIVDVTPIAIAKLVELGTNLGKTLSEWASRLGPIATILWNTLNGAFLVGQELMKGNWEEAWKKLKLSASVIWPQIVDLVEEHLPAWKAKLAEWATAAWQWIVDITPTVVTKIGEWGIALWGWVTTNAPTWLAKLGEWANAAWQWIVDVTPIVLAKLGEWAIALWNWVTTNAPAWGAKLAEWGAIAWQWIVNVTPTVLTKLGEWGTALWGWVSTNAPTWGTKLGEWATAAWQWIVDVIPTVVTKLGEWGTAIWEWITTNAPKWGEKLGEWAKVAWEWIVKVTPIAVEKLGEWAGKLWEWITTNAPKWGSKLKVWGTELWQWIKDAYPETATKLEGWWGVIKVWIDEHQPMLEGYMADWREIIGSLFGTETQTNTTQTWDEWWAALWPKMQDADTQTQLMSLEWEKHLWEWIGDAIPKAIRAFSDYLVEAIGGGLSPKENTAGQAALDQAQKDLEEAIGKALDEVGWSIIVGAQSVGWAIIDGIISGITGEERQTKTVRAMEKLDERIKQQMIDDFGIGASTPVFKRNAEDIIKGFGEGVDAKGQFGVDKVRGFGDAVKKDFSDNMQMESPSRVFKDFGNMTVQGFINGVDGMLGATGLKMGDLFKAVTDKWESIKKAISDKVADILTAVTDKWESIKTAIANKITDILNNVNTKWEEIKTAVANKISDMVTTVGNKWEEIKTAISNKMGDMLTNVTTKIGEIATALTSPFAAIYDKFKGFGANIAQGLIDGVGSLFEAVKTKMSELGTTALNAAKDALGIESPSKQFYQIGEMTAEGFIFGMDSKIPAIRKKATEMATITAKIFADAAEANANNYLRLTGQVAPAGADPATAYYNGLKTTAPPVATPKTAMTYAQQSTALYQSQYGTTVQSPATISAIQAQIAALNAAAPLISDVGAGATKVLEHWIKAGEILSASSKSFNIAAGIESTVDAVMQGVHKVLEHRRTAGEVLSASSKSLGIADNLEGMVDAAIQRLLGLSAYSSQSTAGKAQPVAQPVANAGMMPTLTDLSISLKKYVDSTRTGGDFLKDFVASLPSALRVAFGTYFTEVNATGKGMNNALALIPQEYRSTVGQAGEAVVAYKKAGNVNNFNVNVTTTGDAVRDIRNQVELYALTFGAT